MRSTKSSEASCVTASTSDASRASRVQCTAEADANRAHLLQNLSKYRGDAETSWSSSAGKHSPKVKKHVSRMTRAEQIELAATAAERQYTHATRAAARREEAGKERARRFNLTPQRIQKLNWWENKHRSSMPAKPIGSSSTSADRPRAQKRAKEAACQTEWLHGDALPDGALLMECERFVVVAERSSELPHTCPPPVAVPCEPAEPALGASADCEQPSQSEERPEQPPSSRERPPERTVPVTPSLSLADVGKRLTISADGGMAVENDRAIAAQRVLWGRGGASGVVGGASGTRPSCARATIKRVDARVGGLVEVEVESWM
jgi:hypothetical protein